jgi:hypothetical protein
VSLAFAAVVTLAASVWAWGDDSDVPVNTKHSMSGALPPARAASASGDPVMPLSLPERVAVAGTRRNLFAATVVAPPPMAAAVVAAAPPPPPVITLPFTFGGRLITAAGASVLLNTGAMTQVLALGATLGDFRFEQDSGNQLEFIHVPTGERLVLAIQPPNQ